MRLVGLTTGRSRSSDSDHRIFKEGIQAQSLSVFHLARAQNLKIIPVLNKASPIHEPSTGMVILIPVSLAPVQIDMPQADPERIAAQISTTFGLDVSDVLRVSAKTGEGVPQLLDAIVSRMPSPPGETSAPLRALLFDSS
jgi:translation elongation factor EF-4